MNTAIEEEANIVKKIFILFANSNSYKLNMNRNMQFIQFSSYQ